MKAAVLHAFGDVPRYEEFADPVPGPDELLVHVQAVPLENIDRAVAAGTHFSARQSVPVLPAIMGGDGIGRLADGRLVGFGGMKPPYGAMAELAVVPAGHFVPVPEGMDPAVAAAMPAPALTSAFPLRGAANLQPGETVLVNGATGVAGRLAVQIAKRLGAGRVVGTGRHDVSLLALHELGADQTIDLKRPEAELAQSFAEVVEAGCDIVLDFLWGRPSELLLAAFTPKELAFAKRRVRWIQIGEMAGPELRLRADALRTSGVELLGGAAGLTPESMAESTTEVMDWITRGELKLEIERVPLAEVEQAWRRTDVHGKRLVIVP